MRIKRSHEGLAPHIRQYWRIGLLSALLTGLACGCIGYWLAKRLMPHRVEQMHQIPGQIPGTVMNYLGALGTSTPKLFLHIPHENMMQLNFMRETAIQQPDQKNFQYVSGKLETEGELLPAKLRLKGDRIVHFQQDKGWSFRIELKNGEQFQGMKRFSLHKSAARNHLYEWVFHQLLAHEGFTSLQYDFSELYVNGEYWGLYAVEEHFDKRIIERHELREGPILKFDESNGGDFLHLSVPVPFKLGKWSDPERMHLTQDAVAQMEAFRNRDKKVSEVFDSEKLATFIALTDLIGAHHGAVWKSMRFYYNPMTGLLEPIGFDGHIDTDQALGNSFFLAAEVGQSEGIGWWYKLFTPWFRLLFHDHPSFDKDFFVHYLNALERMSAPDYLDKFFKKIGSELNQKQRILQKSPDLGSDHLAYYGPDLYQFNKQFLYQHQDYIRGRLDPPRQAIHAYKSLGGGLEIEAANILDLPLEIRGIAVDSLFFPVKEESLLFPSIKQGPLGLHPEYSKLNFSSMTWADSMWQAAKLVYSYLGKEEAQQINIFPWQRTASERDIAHLSREEDNLDRFSFLQVNHAKKEIRIPKGKWKLAEHLVTPKGYTLIAGTETQLSLDSGVSILSKGPVHLAGQEEDPLVIEGGNGLYVLQAKDSSYVHQVHFKGMAAPLSKALTGAVTFYESPVLISNSIWIDTQAEDALNLVRTSVRVAECDFYRSFSDAIDLDFCQGRLEQIAVLETGNDAIDLAGSQIEMQDIVIEKAGDKGISVGEGSRAVAIQVKVSQTAIALTSKDRSSFEVEGADLNEVELGIAVYQKKESFGPANLSLSNVHAQEVKTQRLIEKGSTLTLNNEIIPGDSTKVSQKLYGNEYGKASN